MTDAGTVGGRWTGHHRDETSVLAVFRRRRRLRQGLVQLLYAAVGAVAGVALAGIEGGPTVAASSTGPLLFALAGGLLSFIALVFSLLFLVVQFGNTTLSPRLTLFRDDPLVWHSFGFFAAVLVFCTAAGLRLGADRVEVSLAVPGVAVTLVLVSLGLSRALQMRALRLLQITTSMEEVRAQGQRVLERLYPLPVTVPDEPPTALPPVVQEVVWPGPVAIAQQLHLPVLVRGAERADVVIEVVVRVGDELRRGLPVAIVRADRPVEGVDVLGGIVAGPDRVFAQDPLFAFRLLADIGDRALSTAVNDPATAVQVVGCIQDLLTVAAGRRLDLGPVRGRDGRPRVVVRLPTWDDVVTAAIDELTTYALSAPTVARRLVELLDDLVAISDPRRHAALTSRRQRLVESTAGTAPSSP